MAEQLRTMATGSRGTMRALLPNGESGAVTDGYVMIQPNRAEDIADVIQAAGNLLENMGCEDAPQDCLTYSGHMCDVCLLRAALDRVEVTR